LSKRTKFILFFLIGGKILFLLFFILGISNENNATENTARFVEIETDLNYDIVDKGILRATWYGNQFHGRLTAGGEIFDENDFTAAHRTFPFGTLLQLTNLSNGISVVVKVNDRGPVSRNLDLDLSRAAAEQLGFMAQGSAKLAVAEIILVNNSSNMINNY